MFIGCPFPLENVPELIGPGSSGQMAAGYVVASSLQGQDHAWASARKPLGSYFKLKIVGWQQCGGAAQHPHPSFPGLTAGYDN
jgi:hypothetical protein